MGARLSRNDEKADCFGCLVVLTALPLSGIADARAWFANTSIPKDEVTGSETEAEHSNSFASATITITMYTVAEE